MYILWIDMKIYMKIYMNRYKSEYVKCLDMKMFGYIEMYVKIIYLMCKEYNI